MKTFYNIKECLEYLKTKAKEGEEIQLIENATSTRPKQKHYFKKKLKGGIKE